MAANWNNPLLTSLYTDVLNQLKERDTDVLRMNPDGSNFPAGAKRWNGTTSTFQEWNGTAWNNLILSVAGGGTGSGTGTALGTMAFQNANAVAITGGTMSGIALNADAILSGNLTMTRMPLGGAWTLGAAVPFIQLLAGGMILGNAASGNFGPGTINVQGNYYINGVPLASTIAVIPSGLMAYFSGACPAGWTFVANSHERIVRSSSSGAGLQHGSLTHDHGFNVPVKNMGNTGPAVGEVSGGSGLPGQVRNFDQGSSFSGWLPSGDGAHTHTIGHVHGSPDFPGHTGTTDQGGTWPPSIDFLLCRKD